MWTRYTPATLVAAFIVAAAACSDGPAGPADEQIEDQITADVAVAVADQTSDDLAMMGAEGDDVMDATLGQRCARQGRRFICAARRFDDLLIERSVTFYADDVEQDAFDAQTTDSINVHFELSGERSRENWSAAITLERDFTISGLEGDETERTWNGAGSSDVERIRMTDSDGLREYEMHSSTTIANVVVLVPRDGTWPQSGTITREMSVEVMNGAGDTFMRERTVVITFNGTSLVPMTVNGIEFILNLETREVERVGDA